MVSQERLDEIINQMEIMLNEVKDMKVEDKEVVITENISLLTEDEYRLYKYNIPKISCEWWLMNTEEDSALTVDDMGSIDCAYQEINLGIRPVITVPEDCRDVSYFAEGKICLYGMTWVLIDPDRRLYISEVPIAFGKYDDGECKSYGHSYIRFFLREWQSTRRMFSGGKSNV